VPILKSASGDVLMSNQEIAEAEAGIRKIIPDFNYSNVLSIIKDESEMRQRFQSATIGYDKLQLFRIYQEVHTKPDRAQDSILQKFVNESFHIENEYVMQLNPHKFDNIPEYVVQECERTMLAN
jgi:arginyl-tRNA--protein-N-Asp/Glu arginylyltransferase